MPADEARVSIFDSGLMQGVGLFETMRAYGGVIFRLEQHLERLRASAMKLGWAVVPELGALADSVRQVISATGAGALRVRLTVTTGSVRPSTRETPELTIVTTAAAETRYPDEYYQKGVTVLVPGVVQHRLDPLAGHKTVSYFGRLAALRLAHAQGVFEALWLNERDEVAEGSISNLFIIKDDRVLTPPLDAPALPGITRAAILDVARELEIDAEERPLKLDDVLAADEAFLTNSMIGIMPVVRVERVPIGPEKVGDLTLRLAQGLAALMDREAGHE